MLDSFWVNQSGSLVIRNLKEEAKSYDRDKFLRREDGQDLYSYMWQETNNFFDFNAAGCMYEVGGIRVKPDDVVVDIGANIGMWADRAVDFGAAQVFAFEPVRLNYLCLCMNTSNIPQIHPYNFAIGDRITKSTLTMQDNMGFCGNKDIPGGRKEDIVIVTVDWLFDVGILNKIDFLKIDIEGYEDRVLFNISKDRLAKINTIALEYHHNCPTYFEDMIKYLGSNGIPLRFRLDLGDNMKVITFTR